MTEKQLGERIKQLRAEKGLSQEKFALFIDMDRTYFASVESGKRNISLKNIEKIAKGLDVTISQLFEGIGEWVNGWINQGWTANQNYRLWRIC